MKNETMDRPEWRAAFEVLRASTLRTARAWAIKEAAMHLWHYSSRGRARGAWERWIAWARRCALEPMKKVAAMVRNRLDGILNAIVNKTPNALKSINARIQHLKRVACGYRNRERFRNAIYFHLGKA